MDGPIYHLEKVVKAKAEAREDFTGPLDLILYLLGKNKMEIRDIQISLILEQYLAWMEARKEMDLEVASEFVTMAAQLVFIKTQMLLSIRDEQALSEMEELMALLEAHQRHESYTQIKAVLPDLEQGYSIGQDYLVKPPELPDQAAEICYAHQSSELYRALMRVLAANSRKLPPSMAVFQKIVGREPYPVTEKAAEILQLLLRMGATQFYVLFQSNQSRSEVVATFLAVLELCKAHKLLLSGTQEGCTVTPFYR